MDLAMRRIFARKVKGTWNKTEGRTHSIGEGGAGSLKRFYGAGY
jgi:hypothetical protein